MKRIGVQSKLFKILSNRSINQSEIQSLIGTPRQFSIIIL